MKLPLGDRWALGLSRYAQSLCERPVTQEILAWEQIEQNELTEHPPRPGHTPDGGFQVHARLPIHASTSAHDADPDL